MGGKDYRGSQPQQRKNSTAPNYSYDVCFRYAFSCLGFVTETREKYVCPRIAYSPSDRLHTCLCSNWKNKSQSFDKSAKKEKIMLIKKYIIHLYGWDHGFTPSPTTPLFTVNILLNVYRVLELFKYKKCLPIQIFIRSNIY